MKRDREQIRARFRELLSQEGSRFDVAEAALLIAAEAYPLLDVSLYLERLDGFAELARARINRAQNQMEILATLNNVLFHELGFHGNADNYYDSRNSFLNEVIDRRTGIPITLTVVYVEVARRVGLNIAGVGLPYHFIARCDEDGETIFIDVFNRGRLLTEEDCAAMMTTLSDGTLTLEPYHLVAVSHRQIITRVLANLMGIYAGLQDYRRAIAIVEHQMIVNPDAPLHVRDYGLLLAADGQYAKAIAEMERYLRINPEGDDAETIRKQIGIAKRGQARLN